MKKATILFYFLCLTLFKANSQSNYKIELDFTFNKLTDQAHINDIYYLWFGNSGVNPLLIDFGPKNKFKFIGDPINLLDGESYFLEGLITFPARVSTYGERIATGDTSNSCSYAESYPYRNSNFLPLSNQCNLRSFSSYSLKVIPLAPLKTLNEATISETLCIDNILPFKIAEDRISFSYGVEYSLDGINWKQLLPYNNRTSHIEVDPSQINGVLTANNLYFRAIYHIDESSVSGPGGDVKYSDIVIYQLTNCSPKQDGPIIDIQPTCTNSINADDNDNGSFTVTFDRELDDTKQEKMKLEVYRQIDGSTDFDGLESKVLDKNDFNGRSYTWDPKNLPSGTYKLFWQTKSDGTIFDNIDSTPDAYDQSESFVINALPILSVTGTPTRVQCFGGNDGSITVIPSGGTPGIAPVAAYEYSIDNWVTWQQETVFDNLSKGDYTVLIRDTNGCVVSSAPISVEERFSSIPEVEGLQVLIKDPTRIGGNNGRIVITIAGGSGIYTTYTWTRNGNPFTPPAGSTNTSINDLSAGEYTIVVTDNNGCSSEPETFILEDPEPIEITINMTPTTVDCADTKVSLIATTTGGFLNPTGEYSYLWSDGTITATLSNVGIETYSVTVTDNGGNTASKSFEVQGSDPISVTPSVNDVICKKGETGSIELIITGGTPFDLMDNPEGYTVTWTKLLDNTFNKSGTTISNLKAGFYEYEITDQKGCKLNNFGDPIEVIEPSVGIEISEIITAHIDNNIANGNTGVLEIDITNTQGVFTVEWFKDNTPFSAPNGSTNTRLIDLEAGNYTAIVTDAINCSASLETPIRITEPNPLTILSETPTHISCKDEANGKITVTAIGGIEPYTYIWEKQGDPNFVSIDDSAIDGLEPGQYSITVTDDSGSTAQVTSSTIEISEPDVLAIEIQNITPVICKGDSTGAIDITITGGTPPYIITWDTNQITEDIQNLPIGTYTVMIEDSKGCTADKTIEVTNQDNQLQIQEVITNVSTYEGTDGSIAVQIIGGAQPYTVEWTRLADNTLIRNTEAINNLMAGSYHVRITDNNACVIENIYEITQPDIVEETITSLACTGDCNAAITVEVNKGNGNFIYKWDTGETSETITNLCAGSYTVTIEGFGNKTLVRTYDIIDPDPLTIDLGEEQYICLGQTTTLSATINDPNATYKWSADNGFTSNQPEITVNKGGIYTTIVTNSKGCIANDSIIIHEVDAEIKAEFLYTSQVFTNEKLVVIDVTYPSPDQIEWIVPSGAQIITKDQDLVELAFDTPGEYEITLRSTLGNCQDTYTQKILVLHQEEIDNQNDTIQQLANIQEFKAYPNPSNGQFSVNITLKEEKEVSLKIFNLTNNVMLKHIQESGEKEYDIPFTLEVASGVYAIVLETPYGNDIRKMIVK